MTPPGTSGWGAGGLVGLLVLVAAVVLLFTGRYPRSIYDFVLGMDRWALRVAAYSALMTDSYPPFRLDMGGADPGSLPAAPVPPAPGAAGGRVGGVVGEVPGHVPPSGPAPAAPHGRWTAGRTVALVVGAVLIFLSTGLLAGGGALLVADRTQRDGGFVMSPSTEVVVPSHALTSSGIQLEGAGAPWVFDNLLGTARLEVVPGTPGVDLFVGVARTADVQQYLRGVGHHQVADLGPGWNGRVMGPGRMTATDGGPPAVLPADTDIWVAQSTGPGTRVLDWQPENGNWTVVLMRADGRAGFTAQARVGATAPGLPWLAGGLLAVGAILAIGGVLLVVLAVRRAQQGPSSAPPPGPPAPSGDPSRQPVPTGRS